jgi:hypothetical protein
VFPQSVIDAMSERIRRHIERQIVYGKFIGMSREDIPWSRCRAPKSTQAGARPAVRAPAAGRPDHFQRSRRAAGGGRRPRGDRRLH